jgi:hypothetical protein
MASTDGEYGFCTALRSCQAGCKDVSHGAWKSAPEALDPLVRKKPFLARGPDHRKSAPPLFGRIDNLPLGIATTRAVITTSLSRNNAGLRTPRVRCQEVLRVAGIHDLVAKGLLDRNEETMTGI